jgi:hypothetical protein
MDQRFDAMDQRLQTIDQRLEVVDRRRMGWTVIWIVSMDASTSSMAGLARHDSRFDRLEERIETGAAETRRHFDVVAESIDSPKSCVVSSGASTAGCRRSPRVPPKRRR